MRSGRDLSLNPNQTVSNEAAAPLPLTFSRVFYDIQCGKYVKGSRIELEG